MDNNYDEHLIIMQSAIESNKQEMKTNKQYSDEKIINLTEDLKSMLTEITDQIKTLKTSLTYKDSPKPLDTTTVVKDNKKATLLDGGKSTKIGGMWILKHEIRSPKLYEILIKTEVKGDTVLDFKNLYNHINMCLNEVTRLQEDFLPGYRYLKRHTDFS